MIALQEERPGFGFIAVQRAAGGSGNLHIVVIHLAVAHHCNVTAHEGNVEGRPFAQPEFSAGRRRIVTVDGAHLVIRLRTAFGSDLNFVPAAKVDAAVPVVRTVDFNVKLQVLEFRGGLQVGRSGTALPLDLRIVIYQFAVARNPLVVLNVADRLPTGKIFAVE